MPRQPLGERALTDVERARRYRDRRRGHPPLPAGPFGVIYADPPWWFKTRSAKGEGRSPTYPRMKTEAIAALPVRRLAAADAVLLLWVYAPMEADAHEVVRAWGFTPTTSGFTWVKAKPVPGGGFRPQRAGLGYWTRKGTERCLLGTRGEPERLAHDVPELIVAPRREHSRKPDEAYGLIERLAPGPYLELFARPPVRPGWVAWGNETIVGGGGVVDRRAEAWTASQLERRAAVERGESVLANVKTGEDAALIAWASARGLFTQIDRPGVWGNPVKVGRGVTRDEAAAAYAEHFATCRGLHARLPGLRGRVLGCHCYPERCHGEVLLAALGAVSERAAA
jgi:N6-adenosine-specific RNA methylase IME4